jgi:hypothetical protein
LGATIGGEMRYKFDEHAGLTDEDGHRILQLVASGCTKAFRRMAGKELANKLNGIEQSKEATKTRVEKYGGLSG